MKNKKYFIIMADIIGSSNYQDIEKIRQKFESIVNETSNLEKFTNCFIAKPVITLGDEFQSISKNFFCSFKFIQYLNLILKENDIVCRFSLAYGTIETIIDEKRKKLPIDMVGNGLTKARHILNNKEDSSRYRFYIEDDSSLTESLKVSGILLTILEDELTDTQFKIIYNLLLKNIFHKEVAKKLNISTRYITKIKEQKLFEKHKIVFENLDKMFKDIDKKLNIEE